MLNVQRFLNCYITNLELPNKKSKEKILNVLYMGIATTLIIRRYMKMIKLKGNTIHIRAINSIARSH